MSSPKPSIDLVRTATDELVLRTLMAHRRLTRAELAVTAGISKPTASESVRRLTESGALRDTGERTSGRGRVGSYYALAGDVGTAVALSVAPEGVVAERVNVYGDVLARAERAVRRPARPRHVATAMRGVVEDVVRESAQIAGPPRLAVVSAADPVERTSGRLVQLPDAPFLVGELDPVRGLADLVDGPVVVDNDVNWAARAERAAAADRGETLDNFAYLYLGEGVGCALVGDGQVRRGHRGLAGEIAHLVTVGPRGQAVPFTQVFEALSLRQPHSTAVDVEAVIATVTASGASDARRTQTLARAVAGVLAALVALADPELVVLGGPWGVHPAVLTAVVSESGRLARQVRVRVTAVRSEAPLTGARMHALDTLRSAVVRRANSGPESAASAR